MEEELKKYLAEGDELLRQHKHPEAAMLLKRTAARFPHDSYVHYLLGIARMKWGLLLLAKQSFEKADELLPNHADHMRSMGWLQVLLGNLQEGRALLRQAISKDITNPNAYVDLAMSYFHFFEFEEGRKWLDIAKPLASDNEFVKTSENIAREMEKDFSRYSPKHLEKMRKEKLHPDIQREWRISLIEFSLKNKKNFSPEEIAEIKEELRLQGIKGDVVWQCP